MKLSREEENETLCKFIVWCIKKRNFQLLIWACENTDRIADLFPSKEALKKATPNFIIWLLLFDGQFYKRNKK